MGYTSQQFISYIHSQGYSDQEIANAVKASRETITRIRLGKPGYSGVGINKKLEKIVRQLQQEPQAVEQKPREQVVTYVQSHPQVRQPVAAPPQVQPKKPTTLYEQFYCMGCDRVRPPVRLSREEFIQWARSHPCDWKKRGQCPA